MAPSHTATTFLGPLPRQPNTPGQLLRPCRGDAEGSRHLGSSSSSLASSVAPALGIALLAWGRTRRRRGKCSLYAAGDLPNLLQGTVKKKELKQIIAWSLDQRGIGPTVELLEELKKLGFSWATRAGISIGVEDLCVPAAKGPICEGARSRTLDAERKYENGEITVVEKFQTVTGEWGKASEEVKNAAMANFSQNMPTNPVFMMSTSGARGSVSQVRQLVAMRGLMADASGALIEVPISHSLRDGMTITDLLISGHGARKGMIDTAMKTASSGYLYRRIDFASSHVITRVEDCQTTAYMEVGLQAPFQPAPPLKDQLRGRVLAADILDPESNEVLHRKGDLVRLVDAEVIDKRWNKCQKAGLDCPSIRVRSPLTCTLRDGICKKCYGEDLSKPGQLTSIGATVGTVAAQSLGEPGTQLTMRTFHTGGAVEGGGGKGVAAKYNGKARLRTAKDKSIVVGDRTFGRWARTLQGGMGCLLNQPATLEVIAQDGAVQTESLEVNTLVRVQDGEAVTLGQSLFETNAAAVFQTLTGAGDQSKIEKVPQDIAADESGQVVITDAADELAGLRGGSKRVWVLQGTCTSFENRIRCTIGVKAGDILAQGVPLATEWALTSSAGVPRFQRTTPGLAGPAVGSALGMRSVDWSRGAAEHESDVNTATIPDKFDAREVEVSLRTDFDWFFLEGKLEKYRASCVMPEALTPQLELVFAKNRYAKMKQTFERQELAKARKAIRPTLLPIYALAGESHSSVICAAPGQTGVFCPVSRTAHPQHVAPVGGLIFHLPDLPGKGRRLLWAPEDSHHLRQPNKVEEDMTNPLARLMLSHGGFEKGSGLESMTKGLTNQGLVDMNYGIVSLLFDVKVAGYVTVYHAGKPRPVTPASCVVEESTGVIRREGHDRVCCPDLWKNAEERETGEGITSLEIVIKPGKLVACPSKLIDETWWSEASEVDQGLHFHQKAVPPGVPLIPGVPESAPKDWRVAELLDDPRTNDIVRVLVRLTRLVELPQDPEPLHPASARTVTSWHLPYAHGELVRSNEPIALAHEITSSLSRKADEPHGTIAFPAEKDHLLTPSRQKLSSSRVVSHGLSVDLVGEAAQSGVCVVQHSPIGAPQPLAAGSWSEAVPAYIAPQHGSSSSSSKGGSSSSSSSSSTATSSKLPTPRRQLLSEGGCVCQVESESGGRSTVVTLRPEDLARVRCNQRPAVKVGTLLRAGEALTTEARAPCPGQVLVVEELADGEWQVTLRRARAYLVTSGGEVRTRNGAVVESGDLLGTENLVVPKTADITQGLPKISALFEAAGTQLSERLKALFDENEKEGMSNLTAAKQAADQMARELVSEIQSVYLEQGVFINGRHIEIVVSQMLRKCEVVQGDYGARPGDTLDYADAEGLVKLGSSSTIRVEPAIRGVTNVGKDLHILTSMGFREADNILGKAVMSGPGYFPMNGVKENVIMGQEINAGTGNLVSGWKESSAGMSELPKWA